MYKLFKTGFFSLILMIMIFYTNAMAGSFDMVTGWEGNETQGYTFFSSTYNTAIGKNVYIVFRASANYLYYEFYDVDRRTDVRSPGTDAGIALRFNIGRASLSLGPGYEIRQTERNYENGGSTEKTEEGYNLQGSLYLQAASHTILQIISSYSDANEYIWTRGGIKYQLTNKNYQGPTALSLGVEFTGQGNDDKNTLSGGILFEIAFVRKKLSIQMRTGYPFYDSEESSEDSKPYFGAGLYKAF